MAIALILSPFARSIPPRITIGCSLNRASRFVLELKP